MQSLVHVRGTYCVVYMMATAVYVHIILWLRPAFLGSDEIKNYSNSNGRKLEMLLEKDLVMRMGVFLQILSLLVL